MLKNRVITGWALDAFPFPIQRRSTPSDDQQMDACLKCGGRVELEADGRYQCEHCGNKGFYIVTPIPDPNFRPEREDTVRLVWVRLFKGDATDNGLAVLVRRVVQALKDRPVSELRAEIGKNGFVLAGPYFPNEADTIVNDAEGLGLIAEKFRRETA